MQLAIDPGQTLKDLLFGVEDSTWTLNIYELSLSGGNTSLGINPYSLVYGPSSDTPVGLTTNKIMPVSFNVNYTNTSSSSELLLISIQHNEADSINKNIFYIKTTISETSISGLIGAF
jgi:hypothetical protein